MGRRVGGSAAPRRVAIVGAGYAGMAAAVTLAQRGTPVTVFESGPVPGGRARRVATQGHTLDNGQHILVGAYTTLFSLMHAVGVPSNAVMRVPLELHYADGFKFRAWYFPAPLGLLAGLLARAACRGASGSTRCASCAPCAGRRSGSSRTAP